ncbi:hypothetical protein TVAG_365410 [Trichomonas vaginalis G3]|uniref:Glycosyltransferase family 17 protein n=1 Tax=Trichomonas vaginalis (strain ATCC PRA-98 / G3) TaxID=412133 RepID=A2DHI5_TRIV3|nr:beta-1,4-mannosyl-glycoprotein beta-1,4-n-acetylglucosaminyl-transferase family [Trichomonas vaginalis G3]EAY20033.1 hypothetical protein TVAG_365410 [Trichomonas vaginalis G3]KAI5527972.1 beta-1,4-mannosyl-glycoprotein beta-1,4-n-acetylglucosaminyl-transferase family [Trichomonas vaginalis G3]|eukprot:XP_001581019.1 hypothetical protein [Trichomonas vaginalis G3]
MYKIRTKVSPFITLICYIVFFILTGIPSLKVKGKGHIVDPTKRKVFDCVIYNSESYMLYNRLWRLDPYVDHFIVVYSGITHSGLPNNITFAPFEKEIKSYSSKAHFFQIDIQCAKARDKNWCRENNQRKYLFRFLKKFNPQVGDLIIVSDIDEIPTRKGMQWILDHPPYDFYNYKCYMTNHGYTHRYPELWGMPYVEYYTHSFSEGLMQYHRNLVQFHTLQPLGTHCSSCFPDLETYIKKYNSFAHQEFHKYPFMNTSYLFWSHYCKKSMPWATQLISLNLSELEDLVPPHPLMDFLTNPKFTLDITKTIYKKSDLPKLCTPEYDWWIVPHEQINPRYKL